MREGYDIGENIGSDGGGRLLHKEELKWDLMPGEIHDVPKMVKIEERVWKEFEMNLNSFTLESLIRNFQKGVVVAKLPSGEIIGYGCTEKHLNNEILPSPNHSAVSFHDKDGKFLYICALTVAPEYRNSGIGSAIVRRFDDIARIEGCEAVYFPLLANHPYKAVDFFVKNGYEVRKENKWEFPYGKFQRCFIMMKEST